jgi:hypothetical protein
MDSDRFDSLARSVGVTATRRAALRTLAVAAIGAAGVRFGTPAEPVGAEGARAGDGESEEVKPENLFGCKNEGDSCNGDGSQCCSGRCEGKKGKKGKKGKNGKKKKDRPDRSKCVSHNAGPCQKGQDACVQGQAAVSCGENIPGVCFQTTGKSEFCGRQGQAPPGFACATCNNDQDCLNLGWPRDSACVVCTTMCGFTTTTACVGPSV